MSYWGRGTKEEKGKVEERSERVGEKEEGETGIRKRRKKKEGRIGKRRRQGKEGDG